MGGFHCPMGCLWYDDEPCIDCGLCSATTKEEMVEASRKIREYLRSHADRKKIMKKVAICGKGGVGKSIMVSLISSVMTEEGYAVLAIDTDESNPGLYRMFGLDREPRPLMKLLSRFSLSEPEPQTEWIAKEEISIQDIPGEYLIEKDSLKFLEVGKIIDPFQGCACTMADVVRDLLDKLALKDNEVVVIDMEAGIESFGRGVERSVDTVLIIVEPSFESMALAEKVSYMADGIGVNKVRAILNKIPSEKTAERMRKELNKRGVKVIGTVGYDSQIAEACFEGSSLGQSQAREDVKGIVRQLIEESKSEDDDVEER